MDSNHRPAVYETAALPLSYAGFVQVTDTILIYFHRNVHLAVTKYQELILGQLRRKKCMRIFEKTTPQ
jgi:hypothetical protein